MALENEQMERVALAIRDVKSGLNYDYMDFCRDAARAAIAAIEASQPQEAVAWMYTQGGRCEIRTYQAKEGIIFYEQGWTETPLYVTPTIRAAESGLLEEALDLLRRIHPDPGYNTLEEYYAFLAKAGKVTT